MPLKFTNDNGSVELSLIKNNEMFIIRLIDNGIGIEAGEIDRIFERYYQSKGKFYTFSSGIGLALCKEIINLHHGKIHSGKQTRLWQHIQRHAENR